MHTQNHAQFRITDFIMSKAKTIALYTMYSIHKIYAYTTNEHLSDPGLNDFSTFVLTAYIFLLYYYTARLLKVLLWWLLLFLYEN